jgi:hypothetical protein
MKVRVFTKSEFDPIDRAAFKRGTDHSFPMLPSVGHSMFFTDERKGEFVIVKVGFVQDGPAFVPAVWLEGPETKSANKSEEIENGGGRESVGDLNSDIPPASMEGY